VCFFVEFFIVVGGFVWRKKGFKKKIL